jgi:hypothetical protein
VIGRAQRWRHLAPGERGKLTSVAFGSSCTISIDEDALSKTDEANIRKRWRDEMLGLPSRGACCSVFGDL